MQLLLHLRTLAVVGWAYLLAGCGTEIVEFDCEGETTIFALPRTQTSVRLECSFAHETGVNRATVSSLSIDPATAFEATTDDTPDREPNTPIGITITFHPSEAGDVEGQLELTFQRGVTEHVETIMVAGMTGAEGQWREPATLPACPTGRGTPILDHAVQVAGLTRADLNLASTQLRASSAGEVGLLNDQARLDAVARLMGAPENAGCVEGETVRPLDTYLALSTPVADGIRHAAAQLDNGFDDRKPIKGAGPGGYAQALAFLCNQFEEPKQEDAQRCGPAVGALPEDIQILITPILWATALVVVERQKLDQLLEDTTHDPLWWQRNGGLGGMLVTTRSDIRDPTDSVDRAYMFADRSGLYFAAAQLAQIIETTDWSHFLGRRGIQYEYQTPAGFIRVFDSDPQLHPDSDDEVLLHLDLGGHDRYLGPTASNRSGKNAASIFIDLAGDDTYQGTQEADHVITINGHFMASHSDRYAQGAARNGVAMLFDLGGGDDRYTAHRGSQGYAHQGVGVLLDDGGNDSYVAEAGSQGAAQFGIALAFDLGTGADQRFSLHRSQGFAHVAGAAFLVDQGGNDTYICAANQPEVRYPSLTRPLLENVSLCQGAALGESSDSSDRALSGGIGILRDLAGNDTYLANLKAQGFGQWQGIGILSDGAGVDRYRATYLALGAGHQFGIGIAVDDGPEADTFEAESDASEHLLGVGDDFGIGVFISVDGRDTYNLPPNSGGSSRCHGFGLFVELGGDDQYSGSGRSQGFSSATDCAIARPEVNNIAVFIDAGGVDTYNPPLESRGDDREWIQLSESEADRGVGLDIVGQSGLRPAR